MANYGPSAGVPSVEGLPPPNPACLCFNPMAAMFCMTGHVLECHYPLGCEEAQCSHYARNVEAEYETEE